jgi:predicted PurR-regulated permease PerM
MPGDAMDRLGRRIAETILATVYGTLVVAAVQGSMGGLMFWVLGLPAPVLWGVVMGLLAIVPVLGAFIIWIPAAIILAIDGHWAKAIVLTAWGSIVVGGIDNLLYPMLVGNRLQMHTVIAFIAMIGGLAVFGASGIILGPVSVTVTTLLLEMWRNRPSDPTDPVSPEP